MNKLLSAHFARLWKNKALWLGIAAILLCSALSMLNGCRQAAQEELSSLPATLDHYYFRLAPAIGLLCAVFSSLFLGTEYSDGAVRNKIVAGHSRAGIYLADLLLCFTASLLFLTAWAVGGLVGIPFLGVWSMPPNALAVYFLTAALLTLALSALFTLVGVLCTNRALSAVLSILLFLALLVLASLVYNRLCEPEFSSGLMITAEGMRMSEPTPNPGYLRGGLRAAYDFILDLLPTGQSILVANLELAAPLRMALCSIGITAAATLGGVLAFRKKDLK